MDFGLIVSSVSSIPTVASRPFTAAFLLTALGRGIYDATLAQTNGIYNGLMGRMAADVPGMTLPMWMISDGFLSLLLLLMIVEWFALNDPDIQSMVAPVQTNLITPVVGVTLNSGMVYGPAVSILELMVAWLPADTQTWIASLSVATTVATTTGLAAEAQQVAINNVLSWVAVGAALAWGGAMAFGSWLLAGLREVVIESLMDLDEDGSLGLPKILNVAEAGWTATLTIVLVFLPLVALFLFGLTVLGLFLARKWFERQDEQSKRACTHCGTSIYPSALFCHSCRQPNQKPMQVGVFGQPKASPAADLTAHRLNLLARKRCPVCATRLKEKAAYQSCSSCGTVPFADISAVNVYLRALDKKLPQTLLICGVLGAIPLVGIVPGIIYYRLSLVASLRAYIPRSIGCLTRWGIRIATMALIALQPFGLGFLTLPAMCLLNFVVYRQVLLGSASRNLPQVAPASSNSGQAAFVAVPFSGALTPAGGLPVVPTLPAVEARHICTACGMEQTAGITFCSQCGAKMQG